MLYLPGEAPRHRQRRPRARARLEARREPARAEGLRRARATPARRASRASRTSPITDLDALADFAAREQIQLTVVGPGGAARRRRGRRSSARAGCASSARRSAAAQLESSKEFAKSFMRPPRHPDGAPTRPSPTRGRRTRTSTRAARRSSSRPTASPRARAWSSRRPRRRRTRRSTACSSSNAMGDAGAQRRHRGVPRRRGSELHRHRRRRAHACRSRPARTTSACATATRARTPAAWAPIRRRRSSRRRCTRGSCARSIMPTVRGHGDGRHPLLRVPLRRPDDRPRGRPEGARVQLPPRRSGDPADPDAAEERPVRAARARASTARSTASRPSGTGAPRSASCSPRRTIPTTPRKGDAITGLPQRRARTATSSTPAPRSPTASSSPSGGRVLCVTALGDSVKMAQRRAYEAVAAIQFDGMQYRRDIGHPRVASAPRARADSRPLWSNAAHERRRGQGLSHRPAGRASSRRSSARRQAVPPRRWQRPEGGGGDVARHRGGRALRARRRQLLARHGRAAAAVGDRGAARARRPRLRGDGRVAGAASAQSVRARRCT